MDTSNGAANGLPPKRNYRPVKLDEARERTPAVRGLGAWAEQLKSAALNAITPEAVTEIVEKQVEKARAGDAAATKFVLGFIAQAAKPESVPAPGKIEVTVPVEQLRRLAALYLMQHQPATVSELGRVLALEGNALESILDHEWFDEQSSRVTLTPDGRNAVG